MSQMLMFSEIAAFQTSHTIRIRSVFPDLHPATQFRLQALRWLLLKDRQDTPRKNLPINPRGNRRRSRRRNRQDIPQCIPQIIRRCRQPPALPPMHQRICQPPLPLSLQPRNHFATICAPKIQIGRLPARNSQMRASVLR